MINRNCPGYNAWRSMRKRCNNPNNRAYPNYGGRGITICDRWDSFPNFYEDMGPCPPGLTLERRDTNGNYEPTNCYWADRTTQNRNRRFFAISSSKDDPYICEHPTAGWLLQITIRPGEKYCKGSHDLEWLRGVRDACIYERDFLISRGLSRVE